MKIHTTRLGVRIVPIAAALLFAVPTLAPVSAQVPPVPTSLKDASLPPVIERISGRSLTPDYIVDEQAAIALGKALFWDMQAGSDGQACASCHFHAGADNRAVHQLSPGINGGNGIFDAIRSNGDRGPNLTLTADDFPFHVFEDHTDRDSSVLFSTDDVSSSQGVFGTVFNDIILGSAEEDCDPAGGGAGDPTGFHVDGVNVRRVEPRNTPTVINAAFNFRNFWDGRANNIFNGVDPFGRRSPDARILEVQDDGSVAPIKVEFEHSSLASQAVGPALSDFEMSCGGRTFPKLGKKMLSLTPLALQEVAPDDSVLGPLSSYPGNGLSTTYMDMISAAFDSRFWDSAALFDVDQGELNGSNDEDSDNVPVDGTDAFTLAESNFNFFWGLAIQAYEATLISDDSPFDRFAEGSESLSEAAMAGLDVFNNDGKCVNCHSTAMFTSASTIHQVDELNEMGLVERMLMGREMHPYQVDGQAVTANGFGGAGRFTFDIDAEGNPASVGGTLFPGPAIGSLKVTWSNFDTSGNTVECEYDVDILMLDFDGDPSTRDVALSGAFASGPAGCPSRLTVFIEDNGPNGDVIAVHADGIPAAANMGALVDLSLLEPALYDGGFYNIGVRPTAEDIGLGGVGPGGFPLSFARQYKLMLRGQDVPDPFQVDPCTFDVPFDVVRDMAFFPGGFDGGMDCSAEPADNAANNQAIQDMRAAVDGAFKVPTLRNVTHTGPFFHNGGQATLEQVIQFYNRGADFARENGRDLDPDIRPLGLSDSDMANLEAFLESLTDERVVKELPPFDHPQLFVPLGHPGDNIAVVDTDGDGLADATFLEDSSVFLEIPAVGADGRSGAGLPDLKPFLDD